MTVTPRKEKVDHALAYAGRGWPVFPLAPQSKKPLPNSQGFKDAQTREIQVERMWDEHRDANIGMATGKTAGIFVVDIDGEEGSRSLTTLENELGPLPETLEARTGSGGRHLFFKWPAGGREVRNKQALKVNGVEHKGVDVRGEGGYVVLAPSIHPNGHEYSWPYGEDTEIATIPAEWLDEIAPAAKRVAPWERPATPTVPAPKPLTPIGAPLLDRARRYLAECEPAIQGQGGHDKLLWAARAMVVGFGIDDATAISLLWSEFNPRCVPQWDMNNSSERRDFERKVAQARQTPGEKPAGWLLDEFGLLSSRDAMASLVAGNQFANALLSKHAALPASNESEPDSESTGRTPFPVNHFPLPLADYCRQVTEAHVVDASFVALPMLAVAGTAMGNAWRLLLKKGFVVPPLLWIGLVAPSGSNKSGPLNEVLAPLQMPVPIEAVSDAMRNPQGRMVVSDATLEAVVARLAESHRGLLVFRDELAGWVKGFNAYKKGGGDEQSWLEFWGAKSYHLDRKTNNEQIHIHAAAVSILGGIQPKILAEIFDPAKFASGLVPRILVTCPEEQDRHWSEVEVAEEATATWANAIQWLRTRPFAGLDPNSAQYLPHTLRLSPDAKAVYVEFFEDMQGMVKGSANEHVKSFATKAQVQAARMILIHRGLLLACDKSSDLKGPVGVESAEAGVAWMHWCLAEQLRVYGLSSQRFINRRLDEVAAWMRSRGGRTTVRELHQNHKKRYTNSEEAQADLNRLVAGGRARWEDKECILSE